MLRLFSNANYDFIALRHYAYGLTALILCPGLLFLLIKGLNYSIEFTGGTLCRSRARQPVDVAESSGPGSTSRDSTAPRFRISAPITSTSSGPGWPSRAAMPTTPRPRRRRWLMRWIMSWARASYTVVRTEAVGPKVGGELRQKAFLAIFLSFFAVLAYLAYRFEWRFGLAAIIATAHDILATIAFIGFMRLEVSLTVVAAVLSMVGYSLNDTIIIFDRVRENLHKHKQERFDQILNRSINETLPRSVLTHGTTMATLLALAIFGGEVIRPFALVMLFGVFTGTFSSIYIASPVLMAIEQRWPVPPLVGTWLRRSPRRGAQPEATDRRVNQRGRRAAGQRGSQVPSHPEPRFRIEPTAPLPRLPAAPLC